MFDLIIHLDNGHHLVKTVCLDSHPMSYEGYEAHISELFLAYGGESNFIFRYKGAYYDTYYQDSFVPSDTLIQHIRVYPDISLVYQHPQAYNLDYIGENFDTIFPEELYANDFIANTSYEVFSPHIGLVQDVALVSQDVLISSGTFFSIFPC